MSMQRFFVWQCDACNVTVEKPDYGFPDKGWSWSVRHGTVRHACSPACAAALESDAVRSDSMLHALIVSRDFLAKITPSNPDAGKIERLVIAAIGGPT